MDFRKALGLIENLLGKVEKGEIERRDNEPFISFMGEVMLTFQGKNNVNAFKDTVDFLWKSDKDIFDTINRKVIHDKLVDLIGRATDGDIVNLDTIKEMFAELKSTPVKIFEVFAPVYGVEYFEADPLEIGPYTIYNKNVHRKVLLEKYPHSEKVLTMRLDDENSDSDVVIGVCENARSATRANEKAQLKLRRFEDTIRFMIGDHRKRYDVGIFNFNTYRANSGIVLSEKIAVSNISIAGTVDKVPLHQFPINDSEYGHDKIWGILAKDNPSNLEKRIITAIEWSGKALRDEESARAFTQYIFGLEALLQFQQRGVMVSPSITYQISEFAAFIISDEFEGRLEIEKMVKNLYGKRSAIAHGGSSDVNETELLEAMHLNKLIITSLLTNEVFRDFKTVEQIGEWVKIQKYS
ncbi:HEPN domain-containing protein [Bacillus cereus]|nr:HEPN domain-containing protein [Bacillus cereus]